MVVVWGIIRFCDMLLVSVVGVHDVAMVICVGTVFNLT